MSAQRIESLRVDRLPVAKPASTRRPSAPPEERALDWSFRLFRRFHSDPERETHLHDGVLVAIIPETDPEVAALNLEAARQARRKGKPVTFRLIDERGHIPTGMSYEFTIDLRDERWGQEPRPEFNGRTVAEMRELLHADTAQSQVEGPFSFSYENIVVLNGVRLYILDEPEPGVYTCIAFNRSPF